MVDCLVSADGCCLFGEVDCVSVSVLEEHSVSVHDGPGDKGSLPFSAWPVAHSLSASLFLFSGMMSVGVHVGITRYAIHGDYSLNWKGISELLCG